MDDKEKARIIAEWVMEYTMQFDTWADENGVDTGLMVDIVDGCQCYDPCDNIVQAWDAAGAWCDKNTGMVLTIYRYHFNGGSVGVSAHLGYRDNMTQFSGYGDELAESIVDALLAALEVTL